MSDGPPSKKKEGEKGGIFSFADIARKKKKKNRSGGEACKPAASSPWARGRKKKGEGNKGRLPLAWQEKKKKKKGKIKRMVERSVRHPTFLKGRGNTGTGASEPGAKKERKGKTRTLVVGMGSSASKARGGEKGEKEDRPQCFTGGKKKKKREKKIKKGWKGKNSRGRGLSPAAGKRGKRPIPCLPQPCWTEGEKKKRKGWGQLKKIKEVGRDRRSVPQPNGRGQGKR